MTTISRRGLLLGSAGLLLLSGCAPVSGGSTDPAKPATPVGPMGISAIPDQDPAKLARLYSLVAERFASATGLHVKYQPVTDYTAVVRAFEVGDIAIAWMGGLTGVQARSRVAGATAIAQRNIDADFHSLFIATLASGIQPFTELDGLRALAGHTFTFGSETSTSGRLMPEYFIQQSKLDLKNLRGQPGFSGSHDATIAAIASGSFEVGAVNEQVWNATVKSGKVDLSKVQVLWRTPGYSDYHWLARPDVDKTFGAGTLKSVTKMLLGLNKSNAADAAILDLFGATSFIETKNSNYDQIESVAKGLGLLA